MRRSARKAVHRGWFFVLLWLSVALIAVTAYLLDSSY
jgi:hypothetical protein